MLEDQAGFVDRDREFEFPLEGQMIGPVQIHDDQSLTYSLPLPAVPQGTLVDVDNNDQDDAGVQIFAVAYWSNTWGDTFLETRDGTGWSSAYASTITDPNNDYEITGGILIVWSPDDQQGFPTGFGEDGLLFTEDDPSAPIPAGYNIVDLNRDPFRFYKEAQPNITLIEGAGAVSDLSDLSYTQAFDALFDKASREYPFTEDKGVDWQSLYDQYAPLIADASSAEDFYRTLRDFSYQIPDGHVNLSFNADVYYEERGGSFGLVLKELSDGRVIVTQVLPDTPGADAGIQVGAEIIAWDGAPVSQKIEQVVPYFGPYSTEHTRRIGQVNSLTRVPPNTNIDIEFQNPGETQSQQISLEASVEYDSLFATIPSFNQDELALPIEAVVLDESNIGYLQIYTFSDDYNLMARLWERYVQSLIDEEIEGLIIDLRANGGGSLGIALDFVGYFFDEEIILYEGSYYNDQSGVFEKTGYPAKIVPGPLHYSGPIAVLVSPNCVSACEGFSYAMQQNERSIIVGHYPTAGAFGEVGRGQYNLPDDLSMQFPTGRPETPDSELLIEGTGVLLDVEVPITEESALGELDALLEAAIQAIQ
jgi:C-terminal processing protease CtpA/Prc